MAVSIENQNLVIEKWRSLQQKAYWTVMSVIDDKQLAEDILQDTLIIAMNKIGTLRDETKFDSWFLTIAVRRTYEVLAKTKRTLWVDDIATYADDMAGHSEYFVDATLLQAEYRVLVFQIIAHLKPERLKHLFYLRYIEDRTIEQISELTGLKVGTLKAIYHKMRKDISGILNEEYYKHG